MRSGRGGGEENDTVVYLKKRAICNIQEVLSQEGVTLSTARLMFPLFAQEMSQPAAAM